MESGRVPTRGMTSLMRGPLVAMSRWAAARLSCEALAKQGLLPRRGPLVVVIGLLLALAAARGAFANTPPIADAGPDQTVSLGEPVMLMGWAEDPDGDPIACWDWAIDSAPEGSAVWLRADFLPNPLLEPDLPGDYLLSLVVTDGLDCSLPDTVAIYVTEDPPLTDAVAMEAMAASASSYPERVIEAWRSPFGRAISVATNPNDHSCWTATGASVMHLAADGTILSQTDGFDSPVSLSVDTADDSCWVADSSRNRVVHLFVDAASVSYSGFSFPESVSADPSDGSCWVADSWRHRVVRLVADGTQLSYDGFSLPWSVSADSTDGSCWVGDIGRGEVVHLGADGTRVAYPGFGRPWAVSADPADGSCWVADTSRREVVHLRPDGTTLISGGFTGLYSVCADPTDGTCWVASYHEVVHLDADGSRLCTRPGFYYARSVSVNTADGSCWVADEYHHQVVHLRADGTELLRLGYLVLPKSVSVDPTDHSCWVADTGNNRILHLAADGTELSRLEGFASPQSVSVNATDTSCWVADTYNHRVVHLAPDGTSTSYEDFSYPWSVCANPTDGSCWVGDIGRGEVLHLKPDDTRLSYAGFGRPRSVSVNPTDGSCWVADWDSGEVVHLRADGTRAAYGGFHHPASVSVNPTDGSCWVAEEGRYYPGHSGWVDCAVVRLAASGTPLLRVTGFNRPQSVSVNPTDSSCWVIAFRPGAHLAADGTVLWQDSAIFRAESASVDPTDGSCWVASTYRSQVVHLVMAPDTTPPVTTCSLTGDLGDNGWYVSPVTVALSATDEEGGSGVKEIHYAATGAQPIDETVVPGGSATLTITAEGVTELSFWAIDNAGNVETATTITIKVDTTPPTLTAPSDVDVEEADPSGTPVDLGQPTVSDICDPNPTVQNDAPALFPLGATTVTWTATDAAGHTSTAQQIVTVVPGSPDNQLANLRKFILDAIASGLIAPEMQDSLLAKVDAAIAALARGDPPGVKVVMNDLKALVNQVEAQTDRKIESGTAAEIIARANLIIAALGG